MPLTKTQRWAIGADLSLIRMMGFTHLRVLTFTTAGDPTYKPWPKANFLTFPQPTTAELSNLGEFLAMTAAFGFTYEIVILTPDSGGLYYRNGVTKADYIRFLDAIWPTMWSGLMSRIYIGGDLRLGDHDDPAITASHRQWVMDLWPHLVSLCPGCAMGLEVACANATLWDRGADSIAWLRANLTARPPSFIGGELYPASHLWLQNCGWEKNGVVDWPGLTRDWIAGIRAAAGPIPIFTDEMGLAVGADFSEQDQADFLAAAYHEFNVAGVPANLWEFADHPAIGDYGLFTVARQQRAAVSAIGPSLYAARNGWLPPGIQYIPPEANDLAWLMPGGL